MTLNIGWVGCGRHAQAMLLPQLTRLDIRLAAIADVDASALANTARTYGVTATFSRAEDLLAHPGLDAIGIAIGPEQHHDLALLALARGLPVFIEKPPGSTLAQAQALERASEKHKRSLTVGFMKRYAVGNKIARNVLTGGEFGAAHGFLGQYMTAPTYFEGAVDYTPFLLHHCVHYMDLPAYLMGSPLTSLKVRKRQAAPGKLLLHLDLEFASGAIGTLLMGTLQSRGTPMEFVQIMGDHQRLEVDNVMRVHWYRHNPFKVDDPKATMSANDDCLTWQPNLTAAANEDFKGYAALLADWVALLEGRDVRPPSIADGVEAMRWLEVLRHGVVGTGAK